MLPAVETLGLTRRFGALTAVSELSLSVAAGSIFGLLGPNGAGKTTTIKMLTTMLPPSAGTARVSGFDTVRRPVDVRRSIGYVSQMLSADGALTGYENLLLFARLYAIPRQARRQRILDALEFMALTESANMIVRNYSGGMIRRLEIAQSMLRYPMLRRTSTGWRTVSNPDTLAVPALGGSLVVSILMVVVLPAPLGPNRPKIEQAATLNDNSLTAVTDPKWRVRPRVSTADGTSSPFLSAEAFHETRIRQCLHALGSAPSAMNC